MALVCTLLLTAQAATAACLSSEVEANNSDTSANTGVCSGTAVSGTISSGSDYDWYKLDVTGAKHHQRQPGARQRDRPRLVPVQGHRFLCGLPLDQQQSRNRQLQRHRG
ncbi:hypothetical protein LP419_12075 [Massilia sp. H-1]|nr:hypothetical protein LP419_12075 [Massilia sp. H-1]